MYLFYPDEWAQVPSIDPSTTDEAIQKRMKTIGDILKRPDPGVKASNNRTVGRPTYEEDQTDRYMSKEDHLSMGEMQMDLRLWWKGNEEPEFYERLAKFKADKGDEILDGDVYNFWIEEWSRKVKELSTDR